MSFKPTAKQLEAIDLLSSDAKHILLLGGSRSGKTFINVASVLTRAVKAKSRHCILRKHFNHVKQSIWFDTLPKVIDILFTGKKNEITWNKSDWFIELSNGSQIWIGGLDDKERTEKILGKEYSTIYFNECSEMTFDNVSIALTRLAEKTTLRTKAYYDCNPPRRSHWTYKQFIEEPDENHVSLKMNPTDNTDNIDPEYIKDILEKLPPLHRERFLLGNFTQDDSDIFRAEWIIPSGNIPDIAAKFTAVDPAIGEGEENDETAIITMGVDYNGIIHELETISGRWSFNTIVDNCMAVHERHKPEYFGVEYVAFQKALGDVLSKKGIGVTQLKADTDKVRRAIAVTDMFEQGRVRLNTLKVQRQLLEFPNGEHDDYVDAVVYALRMIKDYSQDAYIKKVDKLAHLKGDGKSMVFWQGFNEEKEESNQFDINKELFM